MFLDPDPRQQHEEHQQAVFHFQQFTSVVYKVRAFHTYRCYFLHAKVSSLTYEPSCFNAVSPNNADIIII